MGLKNNGIKRRAVRRPNGAEPLEVIKPSASRKSLGTSKDFIHFEGHVVPEIAKQMPTTAVRCWHDERAYSLDMCTLFKFWKLRKHCKRCLLFQEDEHAQVLRTLIDEWETDEMLEESEEE